MHSLEQSFSKNQSEKLENPFRSDFDLSLEEDALLPGDFRGVREKRQRTEEELKLAIEQEEKMIAQYTAMLTAYEKAKEALILAKVKETPVDIPLGDEESPTMNVIQDDLYRALRNANVLLAIPPSLIRTEVKQLFFGGVASFSERIEEIQEYLLARENALNTLLAEEATLAVREEKV